MKQSTSNLEMAKQLLLNEQKGNPKNFKLVEVKDSLSDYDKELIKEAVLHRARNNPSAEIITFTKELYDAFILINS
ncbi:hypothetical protein BKK55_11145 [Rodentibacter genomosp. 2]|uniref:Uncharacterized protein n=2 Tax=Rodentibacter genomosp. 2 TaxID=1908266 RepID=A0A1V3JBC9_9PAST|nr:hypothetical protein BKK55_11145 [Rodentibacter genomosp. 2]